MPDCTEIVALLSDYLDRDLPPETCAAVQAHLDSCPGCVDAAESLRRTVSMCREYRSETCPRPITPDKHQELKQAFQKVLLAIKGESQ